MRVGEQLKGGKEVWLVDLEISIRLLELTTFAFPPFLQSWLSTITFI